MRETRILMGMPITIEVVGARSIAPLEEAFAWFAEVDARFSPYRPDSELMRFNRGEIGRGALSPEMEEILALADETRRETLGYFDITRPGGGIDPSGIVKGWAIREAGRLIAWAGYPDHFVEAGGDVQCAGLNPAVRPWRIGIRNPFDLTQMVKVVEIGSGAVATSGDYVRGRHIYDPHSRAEARGRWVSLTVIAHDIYDADRLATAAFAMGEAGMIFLEQRTGIEAYAIAGDGMATMTSGFKAFLPKC